MWTEHVSFTLNFALAHEARASLALSRPAAPCRRPSAAAAAPSSRSEQPREPQPRSRAGRSMRSLFLARRRDGTRTCSHATTTMLFKNNALIISPERVARRLSERSVGLARRGRSHRHRHGRRRRGLVVSMAWDFVIILPIHARVARRQRKLFCCVHALWSNADLRQAVVSTARHDVSAAAQPKRPTVYRNSRN